MAKEINDAGNIVTTLSGADYHLLQSGSNFKRITHNNLSSLIGQGFFNVLNYGAVADGVEDSSVSSGWAGTDNTAAIQAAIDACFNDGGGVVFFPKGVYLIKSAVQEYVDGDNVNAQLYIPNTGETDESITVTLMGEGQPNMQTSVLVGWPANNSGAILQSTIIPTTAGTPAVLGTHFKALTTFGSFNLTDPVVKNLNIRARDKTYTGGTPAQIQNKMTGINFQYSANCHIENVRVDTQTPARDTVTPSTESQGIVLPGRSNSAWVFCHRVLVAGYYTGIVLNEHANIDNAHIAACYDGLLIKQFDHGAYIPTILFNGCARNIRIEAGTDAVYFMIGLLRTEHFYSGSGFGTKWYSFLADIKITSAGTVKATGKYRIVESGVTAPTTDSDWTIDGSSTGIDFTPLG